KSSNTLTHFQESYGKDSYQYLLFYSVTGDLFLSARDSIKALSIWNSCLMPLSNFPEAEEDYVNLLFNSGAVEEALNQEQAAIEKFSRLNQLLEQNSRTNEQIYVDSKEAIGRLQKKQKTNITNDSNADLHVLLEKAIALQKAGDKLGALKIYRQGYAKASLLKSKTSFSFQLNRVRLLTEVDSLSRASFLLQQIRKDNPQFAANTTEYLLLELSEADLLLKQGIKEKASEKYAGISKQLSKTNIENLAPFLVSSSSLLLDQNLEETDALLMKKALTPISKPGVVIDEKYLSLTTSYCDALLALGRPDSVIQFLKHIVYNENPLVEFKMIEALRLNSESADALDRLKKMESNPAAKPFQSEIMYSTAKLQQQAGNYKDAELSYQKALTINQSNDALEWQISNSLAILYLQLGDYGKSEKILTQLLSSVPPTASFYGALQQNLAATYIETGQSEKALATQKEIVENEKRRLGEHHPDYAIAISNLAVLYQQQGKPKDALLLFRQALEISKKHQGDQTADYAIKELNLGIVLKDLGDLEHAVTALQHALGILEKRTGKSHPDYALCEYNLAMVYKQQGKADNAVSLIRHAADYYKNQVLELFPAMSEQQQVAYYNKINHVIQDYQQFTIELSQLQPELIAHLMDFRLATKALLLNSSARIRSSILLSSDQNLKDDFQQWLRLKDEIGKFYALPLSEKAKNENVIRQLEEKGQLLEKEISSRSRLFSDELSDNAVGWEKIRGALGPGEAAVEFIRVKASGKKDSVTYAALVLKKESKFPELVTFRNGKSMEGRSFNYYRNSIIFRNPDQFSLTTFWSPLESKLNGVETVYISLDGIYNKINLSTLFDPLKKHYLLDRYKFVLVSNLKEVVTSQSSPAEASRKAALFGFANFAGKIGTSATRSLNQLTQIVLNSDLPPLPGTKQEVEEINKLMQSSGWQPSLYMTADASEKKAKVMGNVSVLHIATHGFFIQTPDEEKQVVLSEGNSNPLLRSGLIFSDIGGDQVMATEDGLLTAYEVKNMTLDKSELVVLSACETGSGDIRNGEGVYGLQRAFMISGVKNVMMSLWKVDDQATQKLMISFYQHFLSHHSAEDALRLAQTELMKIHTDPYYWGGFILTGYHKNN
ncbi:MAG TPA: CHAT domain-containing tetratricopeptide repeat protein, partial [Cyclobacteriaceae bacterium]